MWYTFLLQASLKTLFFYVKMVHGLLSLPTASFNRDWGQSSSFCAKTVWKQLENLKITTLLNQSKIYRINQIREISDHLVSQDCSNYAGCVNKQLVPIKFIKLTQKLMIYHCCFCNLSPHTSTGHHSVAILDNISSHIFGLACIHSIYSIKVSWVHQSDQVESRHHTCGCSGVYVSGLK